MKDKVLCIRGYSFLFSKVSGPTAENIELHDGYISDPLPVMWSGIFVVGRKQENTQE